MLVIEGTVDPPEDMVTEVADRGDNQTMKANSRYNTRMSNRSTRMRSPQKTTYDARNVQQAVIVKQEQDTQTEEEEQLQNRPIVQERRALQEAEQNGQESMDTQEDNGAQKELSMRSYRSSRIAPELEVQQAVAVNTQQKVFSPLEFVTQSKIPVSFAEYFYFADLVMSYNS